MFLGNELYHMEIFKGIHLIPGTVAHVYLIIEPGGLTLIDAGIKGHFFKIQNYIESLGYTLKDVKNIILTHADDDHYGAVKNILKHAQAKVYSSPLEAEAIRKGRSTHRIRVRMPAKLLFMALNTIARAPAVTVDKTLKEGTALPILGGLQVIDTPGHTPGHISLFSPSTRVLFAGDSLRSTGEEITPAVGVHTWDESQAIHSMKKQRDLRPRIVCVGHGPVTYEAQEKFCDTTKL